MSVDPKQIRKALRQITDVLADEAERNPHFAAELANAIGISSKEGKDTRKKNSKSSVVETSFDPFEVYLSRGIDGLREGLLSLDIEQLRNIIRKNRFDSSRASSKWKDENKDRFISLISDAVEARTKQGEAFRNYALQKNKSSSEENNAG